MKKTCTLLRDVPFHRKVPNTTFIVDYFKKNVTDSKYSFLSHFHADHYYGLTKTFDSTIYCSVTTGNLVAKFIGVKQENIQMMKMNEIYEVEGFRVLCYEANHCPGAVGFIFVVESKIYLHTGDFRFNLQIHKNINRMINCFGITDKSTFDMVFIDNTYEDYHDFAPQHDIIENLINDIVKSIFSPNQLAPIPTKFIFTSYFIGKERFFLAAAYFFQWKVKVQERKQKAIDCFSQYTKDELNRIVIEICDSISLSDDLSARKINFSREFFKIPENRPKLPLDLICQDEKESQIDVLPMNQINAAKLTELYGDTKYKRIFVFTGTGWAKKEKKMNFKKKNGTLHKSAIKLVQYPYSEHSSSSELLEFSNHVKYKEIVPTVNFNR